ncbi:MAG: glycosyltransferase family 39 protein [Candidatus Bathyarchaeia archaeon]
MPHLPSYARPVRGNYLEAFTFSLIVLVALYLPLSNLRSFPGFNPSLLMGKYGEALRGGAFLSDDELYALAGWLYIHGGNPIDMNFEHPPLAKYFIGLSELLFGNPTAMGVVFSTATLLVLYAASRRVLRRFPFTVLPALILGLDKLYAEFSCASMLEVYVVFFTILTVLLLLASRDDLRLLPLAYLALGLALSCKWTAFFLVPGILISHALNREWRHLKYYPLGLLVALGAYMCSYAVFFAYGNGLTEFMEVQLRMIRFQEFMRLQRGTPPPFWILLNFVGGVEGPAEHRTVTLTWNNTLVYGAPLYGLSMIREWNPLTWPISFSASILCLLRFFASKKTRGEILFPVSFLASLLMTSYGQVFIWYILPALPLGFLALSSFLEGEYEKLQSRRAAKMILTLYIALILTFRFFIEIPSFIPLKG